MEPKSFREAVQAIHRGDREEARHLMRQVLLEHPDYAPAWLWMSGLVETMDQQRDCLERALALDPSCEQAREGLDIINIQEQFFSTPPAEPSDRPLEARKLGSYLIERNLITEEQLEEALTEQINTRRYDGSHTPLGDILIQRGWLTPRALASVLIAQQQDRLRAYKRKPSRLLHLGEYLVMEGIITPDQLAAVLAEQSQLRLAGENVLLGALLIRGGYVTHQALETAVERQFQDFFNGLK